MKFYYLKIEYSDGKIYYPSVIYKSLDEANKAYCSYPHSDDKKMDVISIDVSIEDMIFALVKDQIQSTNNLAFSVREKLEMVQV
jgi:hypothetical protein